MPKFCLTLLLLLLLQSGFAQRTITGIVTEAGTGEPLIGANVVERNTTNGTVTDIDGKFSFKVNSDSLVISYTGYSDVELKLGEEPYYEIEMRVGEDVYFCGSPIIYYTLSDTYLPSERIDRLFIPATNPVQILNYIPGVIVHNGTLNTNRITLRGIGNRSPFATAKLRAYLGDIPLTNGSGETILEDYDLSMLRGLTAEAGPGRSEYGAALGGTVLLNPLAPDFRRGNKRWELAEDWTVGSFGLLRQVHRLHYADQFKDLRLHYHQTRSNGYRDNNEYDRRGISMLYRQRAKENGPLFTFFGEHTDVFAEIPSALNFEDFTNNPTAAAGNWAAVEGFEDYRRTTLGLNLRSDYTSNWDASASVFARRFGNYESRPFNILRENVFALGARASVGREIADELELTVGVEFQNEVYDYQTNRTAGGILDTLRSDLLETRYFGFGFLRAEYAWNDFTLQAGLNLNFTDYTVADRFPDAVDQSGDFNYGTTLAPRLQLGYTTFINGLNDQRLELLIARGFSIPSVEETLLPDGQRNSEIEPETGWNYEFRWRNFARRDFNYELRLYHMDVQNLLVARRTAEDAFVGVNAGRTAHTGLELRSDYARSIGTNAGFTVRGTYQYSRYRFKEFIVLEDDFSGKELTGQPAHALRLEGNLTWKRLTWQTTFRHLSEQPITDDNSVYGAGYSVVGTSLNFEHQWGLKPRYDAWNLRLQFGVDNLFDVDYASMFLINARGFGGNAPRYYYPGLPRNYFGRLALGFRF